MCILLLVGTHNVCRPGRVAVINSMHGTYLSAQPDGSMICNRKAVTPLETFSVVYPGAPVGPAVTTVTTTRVITGGGGGGGGRGAHRQHDRAATGAVVGATAGNLFGGLGGALAGGILGAAIGGGSGSRGTGQY